MSLYKGVVKWFNDKKGFGFIHSDKGLDIFFHYSALDGEGYKTVLGGEIVYYELSNRDKGPFATQVFRTYLLMTAEEKLNEAPELKRVRALPLPPNTQLATA